MEPTQPLVTQTEQNMFNVQMAPIAVSISCYLSGVVFWQFGEFWIVRAERVPRITVVSAVMVMVLHTAQVSLELWTLFDWSTTSIFGEPYSFSLYECLETFLTLCPTLVVQYHFSRLVYALIGRPRWWILLVGFLNSSTIVGGIGSAKQFMMLTIRDGLHGTIPLIFHSSLLGFYILWLVSGCVCDVLISMILSVYMCQKRAKAKTPTIRSILGQLISSTIKTFTLSSASAFISVACVIVPRFLSDHAGVPLLKLHMAAFVSNLLLSRIYIISFCK
ncbi:hypothetical protein CROQUDRAFT_673841 [Cronartium quercuum f. sp. fusiforme G11]|uniref:Uncharacterized protein n=1 Tax=Cronartium quercuum f. sp. fusiforme G11 TaxID=708437 RepID=A0A9P6NDA3_9BASI|nr:hypothetical protein CROQUDRAFT_673841 [Cronartium quercuum f. sp. fusiforme G11]